MSDSGELQRAEGASVLRPGSRLGRYQIIRQLGEGGMGAVFEASHAEIGKRVAIKILSPKIAALPGARVRFLREAQLTSKIHHPHIVDVTDMREDDGHTYLVMELLSGEDLSQRLARGAMSSREVADIMIPVCAAVGAAHQAGITHRDLKPQNIFLARGPHGVHPKVLDFGISKANAAPGATGELTQTGNLVGTPFYFAPEQIADARTAGPASDQYALGVILYECLAGRRPYESDNLFTVFQAIVAGTAPPPRSHRADIPAALEAIVLRAMSVEPKARFSETLELGRALLEFASPKQRSIWEDAFGSSSSLTGAVAPAPVNEISGPITPPPPFTPATPAVRPSRGPAMAARTPAHAVPTPSEIRRAVDWTGEVGPELSLDRGSSRSKWIPIAIVLGVAAGVAGVLALRSPGRRPAADTAGSATATQAVTPAAATGPNATPPSTAAPSAPPAPAAPPASAAAAAPAPPPAETAAPVSPPPASAPATAAAPARPAASAGARGKSGDARRISPAALRAIPVPPEAAPPPSEPVRPPPVEPARHPARSLSPNAAPLIE